MSEDSVWTSAAELGESVSLNQILAPPVEQVESMAPDLSFDLGLPKPNLVDIPKPNCDLPPPMTPKTKMPVPCFEEETRTSWTIESSKPVILKEALVDEDSQASFCSQRSSSKKRFSDDEVASVGGIVSAEHLVEYQWPPEKGEFYMLQEQLSEYLGAKSFKRKYPELVRRQADMDEKQYLKDKGTVSETLCELGLTALRSDDVMELMGRDYPDRYQEYLSVLQDRQRQSISEKHREYATPTIDKCKLSEFVKNAVRSAAEYNSHLNTERKEERRACFDLQTHTIHFPISKVPRLIRDPPKVGCYPVALLPGQFQDYYRRYNSQELKYLPLNTVLYGPPQELQTVYTQAGSESSHSDSEDSSVSEASCCSSSQGTRESGESSESDIGYRHRFGQYRSKQKLNALCKVCQGGSDHNKDGKSEDLVHCAECNSCGHPTCLDLTDEMVDVIRTYPWQCMDCKTCARCMDPYDEDKMMFCDRCDRGYHTFCVGLKGLPSGRWLCQICAQCTTCGTNTPGPEGSKAQWHHEGGRRPQLLCSACHKQRKQR